MYFKLSFEVHRNVIAFIHEHFSAVSVAFLSLLYTSHYMLIKTSILASFANCYSAIRQFKYHVTCLFHLPNPGLNVKPDSSALMKSSRGELSREQQEERGR